MELSERSSVVIVVHLLSITKDQVKGYRTWASECFPSALETNGHIEAYLMGPL